MTISRLFRPVTRILAIGVGAGAIVRESVDLFREILRARSALEAVYVGQSGTASGESTSGSPSREFGPVVRIGQSGDGKKTHIVREISYKQRSFLCGVPVTATTGLHHATYRSDMPSLCKSCKVLFQKGAR